MVTWYDLEIVFEEYPDEPMRIKSTTTDRNIVTESAINLWDRTHRGESPLAVKTIRIIEIKEVAGVDVALGKPSIFERAVAWAGREISKRLLNP